MPIVDDFLKLGFTHTIEVLGKGEDGTLHCVHKVGLKPTDLVIIQDGNEFQRWLRYGFETVRDCDQYKLATFVAISGHMGVGE